MKKTLLWVLVLVAAVGALAFGYLNNQKKDVAADGRAVVKIGAILPLTGNLAPFGQGTHHGIILAFENLSQNTKFKYELVSEDTGDGIAAVPKLATKLFNLDKVGAVITVLNHIGDIVGQMASTEKKIHFGSSWFPSITHSKYNFNIYFNLPEESHLMAQKIKQDGHKTVALINVNQVGCVKSADLVRGILSQQGLDVCKELVFNFGERDFKISLAKIKEACNPDFYVMCAFPPEADLVIKQMRELYGFKKPVTGMDLGVNGSLYEHLEGYWFPSGMPDAVFVAQYTKRFQAEDYWYGGSIGYVTFNMLVDAYEHARADDVIPTAEEVSDYLHSGKTFDSPFGPLAVQPSGQIDVPVQMMMIKDGKPVPLGD